jgi:hypothetical protein
VGPGGTAITDEVDAMGFKWERKGRSSEHIPFDWTGLDWTGLDWTGLD